MSIARFFIKSGDRAPSLKATLKGGDGQPIDLTDAQAVRFLMEDLAASAVIEEPRTSGVVRYDWAAGDTDSVGLFDAEFEIDWGAGVKQTVPSRSYIKVQIEQDVG